MDDDYNDYIRIYVSDEWINSILSSNKLEKFADWIDEQRDLGHHIDYHFSPGREYTTFKWMEFDSEELATIFKLMFGC